MDKKTLVKKLNIVFSGIIQTGKKYAEVWLTEMDFSGMYRSGMYVLHVKLELKADDYTQQINDVFDALNQGAGETLPCIWSVKIHNPDDYIERHWDDIEVYNEEMAVK